MHNKILTFALLIFISLSTQAQFYTITKEREIDYSAKRMEIYTPDFQDIISNETDTVEEKTMELPLSPEFMVDTLSSQKCNDYALPKNDFEYAKARGRTPRSKKEVRLTDSKFQSQNLPELTIPNLYAEIKRNNIKYPKIVLAQAILETGWFKSSVCRNKNNLFGLTNPRTKTYYEFDHWTESVKAYYSKVQYRYKGGNYLLWLRNIGYAEDKGYIQAVLRVLRQL